MLPQDTCEQRHMWIKDMSTTVAWHPSCHAQLGDKLRKAIPIRDIQIAAHHGFLHHHSLQPFSSPSAHINRQCRCSQCPVGKGIAGDQSQCQQWFQKAADGCIPEAMYKLAQCFEDGWGCVRDLAKAVDLYTEAAEGECARLQFLCLAAS